MSFPFLLLLSKTHGWLSAYQSPFLRRDMARSAPANPQYLSRLAWATHWEGRKTGQPGKPTCFQMSMGSDTQVAKRCPPCNHKLTLESWLPPSIALCSRTIPTYSLPEKWQKSSQVWPLSFLYCYMLIFPFCAAKACNLMTSFCKISIKTGFMVWTWERNGDAPSH